MVCPALHGFARRGVSSAAPPLTSARGVAGPNGEEMIVFISPSGLLASIFIPRHAGAPTPIVMDFSIPVPGPIRNRRRHRMYSANIGAFGL